VVDARGAKSIFSNRKLSTHQRNLTSGRKNIFRENADSGVELWMFTYLLMKTVFLKKGKWLINNSESSQNFEDSDYSVDSFSSFSTERNQRIRS